MIINDFSLFSNGLIKIIKVEYSQKYFNSFEHINLYLNIFSGFNYFNLNRIWLYLWLNINLNSGEEKLMSYGKPIPLTM